MKYLSSYIEQAQSEAFKMCGAFFAFSNKQFKEQRQEGIEYVSMGYGLICPKDRAKELNHRLDTILIEGIQKDVEENGAVNIIEREYFNHECQITKDTTNTDEYLEAYIEQYPELFTREVIQDTYKKAFKKAVDNDWF